MNSTSNTTVSIPLVRLVIILGMLAAFAPFATDMYLPAFSHMAESLSTTSARIQSTLSTFFLGLAVGQILYGPLIDRFGRRIPLLIGIVIFTVASAACLLTSDVQTFYGLRILQAIGGCSGMIIGRAIVNDLFKPTETARVLSLLMMVMTLAPIVAPLVGGWIFVMMGWRAIFVFLAIFGLLCGVLVWFGLPETLPLKKRQKLGLIAILRNYDELLSESAFMMPTLVGGLAQSCMFAFITGSPFVFIELFHVSEQHYGWLFGLNALGLIIASQINRMALRHYRVQTLLSIALLLNLGAGIALLIVSGTDHLALLMVPLWFCVASIGFIGANASAIAMGNSGKLAGSGSALIGVIQFGSAFLVSSMVAACQDGTPRPMVLGMLASGVGASLLWFFFSRSARQPRVDAG